MEPVSVKLARQPESSRTSEAPHSLGGIAQDGQGQLAVQAEQAVASSSRASSVAYAKGHKGCL